MFKQDCEHISHGMFNYADRKHKCKRTIKCGVNHTANGAVGIMHYYMPVYAIIKLCLRTQNNQAK